MREFIHQDVFRLKQEQLAEQFAEANHQDQHSLRQEAREWEVLIAAIIEMNGGELRVPRKYLEVAGRDPSFTSNEDIENRSIVFRR